jgi:hypothetical protein
MSAIETWPDKIWLQNDPDSDEVPEYIQSYDQNTTWFEEEVSKSDVAYIRFDIADKMTDELKAELDALRKDAERYRWLRSHRSIVFPQNCIRGGAALDEMIDNASMSENKTNKGD